MATATEGGSELAGITHVLNVADEVNQDHEAKDEWEKYQKSGVLTELVCAFSHDKPHYPPKMVFVNQKMEENLGMIGKYMGELGGYFYMCGLAVAAPGIETALKKAMIGAGIVKAAEADTWIEDLKKSGRYSMESY